MSVLQDFSQSKKEKLLYISRIEARRQQITEQELYEEQQQLFEEEHQLRLEAESKAQQAEQEKQALIKEVAKLKAELNKSN